MNILSLRILSLTIFLSIFILGSAHPTYSDELAPGYNQCMKKVDSKIDKLSNSEIRHEVARCLENAEKYWQNRLMKALKGDISRESYPFKGNKAMMQEELKNYKKALTLYLGVADKFLQRDSNASEALADEVNFELRVRTLSDFVKYLEQYYHVN